MLSSAFLNTDYNFDTTANSAQKAVRLGHLSLKRVADCTNLYKYIGNNYYLLEKFTNL